MVPLYTCEFFVVAFTAVVVCISKMQCSFAQQSCWGMHLLLLCNIAVESANMMLTRLAVDFIPRLLRAEKIPPRIRKLRRLLCVWQAFPTCGMSISVDKEIWL